MKSYHFKDKLEEEEWIEAVKDCKAAFNDYFNQVKKRLKEKENAKKEIESYYEE